MSEILRPFALSCSERSKLEGVLWGLQVGRGYKHKKKIAAMMKFMRLKVKMSRRRQHI